MAEGACIPRHPSRPSQKVKTFSRFTMTIGTGGVGFVYVIPSLANDTTQAYYSGSTFVGPSTVNLNATTTGVNLTGNNSPYSVSSFTSAGVVEPLVQGRMVSCGVSIQYTGTKLNEGGLYYMYVDANHNNLYNKLELLGQFSETLIKRVTDRKEWLVTSSVETRELEYFNNTSGSADNQIDVAFPYSQGFTFNTSETTTGGSPMAIYVTGTAGNTFEVEIVQHIEYVGRSVQSMLTPTHGDSRGFEIVANASARLPALRAANPGASTLKLMGDALKSVAHALTPVAKAAAGPLGALAGAAAGSYFNQPAAGFSVGHEIGKNLALQM